MAVPPDGTGASRQPLPFRFSAPTNSVGPERGGIGQGDGGRCKTCRTRPLTGQFRERTQGEAAACELGLVRSKRRGRLDVRS